MAADPVGLPGLAALVLGWFALLLAVLATRLRAGSAPPGEGRRARRSLLGVTVQGLAFAVAWVGPPRVVLDPLGAAAVGEAVLVAALMASCVALFAAAARAMGRNWSIVARTRGDHQLVTAGPFRRIRNPIYAGLALALLATALALGHSRHLLLALPLFALGTWLRVREEERLLRAQFGAAYDRYAAATARFVPGLF